MVTLVSGLIGGFVATVVMTVFMLVLGGESPPPTAVFWSQYVGDGTPEESMMPGLVLHAFYGTVAGGVFAVLVPAFTFVSVASVSAGILWGLGYAVILFIGAAAFWINLILDMNPSPAEAGMMLVFHLVYGAVLGGWIGYGILA